MKSTILLSMMITSVLIFTACENNKSNTPDTYKNQGIVNNISSLKRGYSDLITTLYNDILEKNKDLKALEDSVGKLKDATSEKTENINKFFENNQNYYNAAYARIEIIQDSVLREKIFEQLSKNENTFNSKTKKLTELLGDISQKQAELNDYYTSLKILITMKQNEDYQNNNLPDTNTISGLKSDYFKIIKIIQEKINQ